MKRRPESTHRRCRLLYRERGNDVRRERARVTLLRRCVARLMTATAGVESRPLRYRDLDALLVAVRGARRFVAQRWR